MADSPARLEPEALARRLAVRTAGAWVIGVLCFAALAVVLARGAVHMDFDANLRLHAFTAYGLGYWDDEGSFHGEFIAAEPDLHVDGVRISVARPEGVVFGPPVEDHGALVETVLANLDEVWTETDGRRTLAIPSYDERDNPVGAVVVSASTVASWDLAARYTAIILAAAVLLIALGLALSRRLAARVLTTLQASIDEREQLLAGAAHELRTPMATLSAVIDAAPPERAQETLAELRVEVRRASRMVEALLTWSRLAHADLRVEPVRLDLLVELCIEEHEDALLELPEAPLVVEGDPRLLEIAVRNLVHNARVHGDGLAKLRVYREGERALVEVHDRGPGLPEGAEGEALLEPFRKGAESRGSGLGLALVRRIAAKHGGELQVRPAVALSLPRAPN